MRPAKSPVMNNGAFDAFAGGFVGTNTGSISNSYASGAMLGTNGDVMLGGFAAPQLRHIITPTRPADVTVKLGASTLGGFTAAIVGTMLGLYRHRKGSVTAP